MTKVILLYGKHEERFGRKLYDVLNEYSTPVLWTDKADAEPEVFGDSAEALELRAQYPWLDSALFAHVQDLTLSTTNCKSFEAAGETTVEVLSFRLRSNSITLNTVTVGNEDLIQPTPRESDVRVVIERTRNGFLFAYVSGYAGHTEAARIQLSRMLTGKKTLQIRPYYFREDEVTKLMRGDVKGNNIGRQYHFKVDRGGSVLVKDTKDSPRMGLIAWLIGKKLERLMQVEFESKTLQEWVEIDGRGASLTWELTDEAKLVDYARKYMVPTIVALRGGTSPLPNNPFK